MRRGLRLALIRDIVAHEVHGLRPKGDPWTGASRTSLAPACESGKGDYGRGVPEAGWRHEKGPPQGAHSPFSRSSLRQLLTSALDAAKVVVRLLSGHSAGATDGANGGIRTHSGSLTARS